MEVGQHPNLKTDMDTQPLKTESHLSVKARYPGSRGDF